MDELEMIAFKIISGVGTARSCYIEAVHASKAGDYEQAERLIADESFVVGHEAHASLLTKEANEGQGSAVTLLILHAEDQLMSAEAFKIIAQEFIDAHKRIDALEAKVK